MKGTGKVGYGREISKNHQRKGRGQQADTGKTKERHCKGKGMAKKGQRKSKRKALNSQNHENAKHDKKKTKYRHIKA
jgi:hypothetical protein